MKKVMSKFYHRESQKYLQNYLNSTSNLSLSTIVQALSTNDARIKLIRLVRSFGQATAIAAGLKRARGDAVIMMDADLQDPPEVIPQLLAKWDEHNKIVYVARASQSQSYLYKVLAKAFYRTLTRISAVPIPIDAGEFRLIDRDVVDFMNALQERSRFMRGLTVWPGFKSEKIHIVRAERLSGATNYNMKKSMAVAIDGFVSFSILPLRLATLLGLTTAALSIILSCLYIVLWIFDRSLFGPGWMSLFLAIMFMGGLNLFCMGIVGEYVGRAFMELQGRPLYLIDYEIGFDKKDVSNEGTV
jgi:polyisoprenyl-phosphate glycosyltransferase